MSSDLAARRGMTRTEDELLMVLEDASGLGDAVPDGLEIERLAPEDADRHARLAVRL